jgi:hypothetical protein
MYSYGDIAMRAKPTMATDKARLVAYCDPTIKTKLEALAELRIRSVSNLIESILTDAIAEAEKSGELTVEDSEQSLPSRKQLSISELD